MRELEDGDADLLLTIVDMRSFARAKEALDHAKDKSDIPMTPAILRVLEIEAEAIRRG